MENDKPIVIVTYPKREHLLTVEEYASLVRMHPGSIYRLIREAKQPGVVRVGRHIRINATIAAEARARENENV